MAINKTPAGTWCVDFRDQHRRWHQRTFRTRKEAAAYEKKALAEVAAGEFAWSDKTVREIANDWYDRKAKTGTYRRSSLIDYRNNHLEHYIKPNLGDLKLHAVDVQAIEKAAAEWGERVSPKMVNKVLTTLTSILALAKRYRLMRDNPARDAERLKIATEHEDDMEVNPDQVYSKAELRQLIEATAHGTVGRLLVMVPALTGLRIGKVLGLTWPAVDLKAGKLHVRYNLADTEKGHNLVLQPPKTKTGRRTLPISGELTRELKVWKLKCPQTVEEFVFAREAGRPHNRKAASSALDRAIEKTGIKRLTPHGLRHTFASLLLAEGVPVAEVSHLLGHKDSYVTLKVYAHFVRTETSAVQDLAASIMGNVSIAAHRVGSAQE